MEQVFAFIAAWLLLNALFVVLITPPTPHRLRRERSSKDGVGSIEGLATNGACSMWGVLRVAPRDDSEPIDHAAFDGWYYKHADAQRVYTEWAREHPGENVFVVKQSDARWSHVEDAPSLSRVTAEQS